MVGGEVERNVARRLAPADTLEVDGNTCTVAELLAPRTYMFNKPAGCVCADRDGDHPTVLGYFGDLAEGLHCVGRLDIDARGLLVVTEDGALNHAVASPRAAIPKAYEAVFTGTLPSDAAQRCARGVRHHGEDRPYQGARLEVLGDNAARLVVCEGRFHEVKRIFECLGCEVTDLRRVAIGGLALDPALAEGEFRPLSPGERELLTQPWPRGPESLSDKER